MSAIEAKLLQYWKGKKFRELPNTLPPVPPFDPEWLPESLRLWLTDIAERMNCPMDFVAAPALVCLGAVVGRQVAIRPERFDDWTVVPNLWGAIIGKPGMLKSPALASVMEPLRELENDARKEHGQALQEHKADSAVRAASSKLAQKKIESALQKGDENEAKKQAFIAAQGETPEPVRRRYIANDTTVEKLGELLASNPRGVLVFRDELTGWLRNLDKQGQEGSRAFYLEAWNGSSSFVYDRIGRGTVDIEAACVSVLGGIQPGPLSQYMREAMAGGAGDDGLLQRLQIAVWPDVVGDWEDCDRKPNAEAREAAYETFRRLDRIEPAAIGAATDGLPFLRFDDEAQEAWKDWRAELEYELRDMQDQPAVLEAVIAKQRSLLPSLALLIHIADCPEGGPVSFEVFEKARLMVNYLEMHARRIYGPALNRGLTLARELAKHIRKGDLPNVFQASAVYLKGWSGLDRQGAEDALEYLAEHGWVARVEVRTRGRPRTDWHLRPELRQEFKRLKM